MEGGVGGDGGGGMKHANTPTTDAEPQAKRRKIAEDESIVLTGGEATGGGIINSGRLTVSSGSSVSNNTATSGVGQARGGGVENAADGTAELGAVTIGGNRIQSGGNELAVPLCRKPVWLREAGEVIS